MDDLLPWLRAQIAERAALASAVEDRARRWHFDRYAESVTVNYSNWYVACGPYGGPVEDAFGAHIAANDPAAVLAQCEAHTAILDRWEHVHSEPGISGPDVLNLADEMLAALALAYQHCPGYRNEWRP